MKNIDVVRAALEELMLNGSSKEEILRKSQELDVLIVNDMFPEKADTWVKKTIVKQNFFTTLKMVNFKDKTCIKRR